MRGYTPVLFLIITPLLAAPVPDLGLKAHLQNVKNNVENFFDPNRASNAPPNAYQQAPQTENYETGSPTNGSYDPSTGSTYVDPSNADPYTSSDPTATNASEEDEEEPDSPTGSDNGDEPYSPDSDGGDGPNSPTSPLNQQIDNTNPFSR